MKPKHLLRAKVRRVEARRRAIRRIDAVLRAHHIESIADRLYAPSPLLSYLEGKR